MLLIVFFLAMLFVADVHNLPVHSGSSTIIPERPECMVETPMNKTRCIADTNELSCNDMTTEICTCPINYFCHSDDQSVCYFTCLEFPAPQMHEFNMNMLRGSDVPGFLDETSEE